MSNTSLVRLQRYRRHKPSGQAVVTLTAMTTTWALTGRPPADKPMTESSADGLPAVGSRRINRPR
jgi:hypothetical protein